MNKELIPSWSVWLIGTIITAILPFLVAFFKYISSDFKGIYIDYIGLSDTLAFLFSISTNCVFLSADKRKIADIKLKRLVFWFSVIVAFVTGSWYFFSSGDGVDNKNCTLFFILVSICVINMLLGSIHEYVSDKNQQKKQMMEKCKECR